MNNRKSKLAFSLIELSIVILIIGLLIVGISKGSRIIRAAKLSSARNLTLKSPVTLNADNLGFWLDTTSEASFDTLQAIDGKSVTNWYDINPHAPKSFNLSACCTPTTYIANGVNGLPSLKFAGTSNSAMAKASVPSTALSKDGQQITIFVVNTMLIAAGGSDDMFIWSSPQRIMLTFDGTLYFDFGTCCGASGRMSISPPTTINLKPTITSVVRRGNGEGRIRFNGKQYQTSSTFNGAVTPATATFSIGTETTGFSRQSYNELIVFRTALQDSEIITIEKYLSAKWGIALNGL